MSFPYDYLDSTEEVMLDTNPSFARFVWPLLEAMAITGICWLIIGFMDNEANAASDFGPARQLMMLVWLILLTWRLGAPALKWLGDRLVVTDRRILLRRGVIRQQVTSVDLFSVREIRRKGKTLVVWRSPYGEKIVINNVPSTRKVAKMVNRLM